MVDDQLHKKDGSSATSGSKVKTRAVNKLKMWSKTGEVASVGLKGNKACLQSFRGNLIRFLVENRSKNQFDELPRNLDELHELLIEAEDPILS